MFELFLGALLGTISSLIISHVYYRKSTQEMDVLINKLQSELQVLSAITSSTEESVAVVKKIVVVGTPDDPEFPYK